ncbi:MAG: SBBP repeat-containing protein, partial [Candidatus Cloacimonetes bacterium]|nr:SBBP repeat-containing protein [Candidatus Cloacimonadota bacterium]
YVTGYFQETATFGSYSLTSSGEEDIFAAKMDADGNWQWAIQAGGTDDDRGFGITVDAAGNSYVTGYFRETATFGSYSLTSSGWDDVFVTKIDANGNWQWAIQAGGVIHDIGIGITIDAAGNSYVAGCFGDTATFGPYSLYSSGLSDIFLTKIDADGNWQWVTQTGGNNYFVAANGITGDDAGNTYVTGEFGGTVTFGSYSITSSGKEDIFAAKMDTDGNWQWATKAGGNFYAIGYGITIDDIGNCYVTGCFGDTVTFGSYSLTSIGHGDIFVAKLNSSVSVENEIISTEMELSNYPNPFKPSGASRSPATTIYFSVAQTLSFVNLEIYNIKGQKIKTFVIGQSSLAKGKGSVVWDGTDENNQSVTSGVYLYKLKMGNEIYTRKMLLLR